MSRTCKLRETSIESDTCEPCAVKDCTIEARQIDEAVKVGVGSCSVNDTVLMQEDLACVMPSCSDDRSYCGDEMAIAMGCPKKPVQQF